MAKFIDIDMIGDARLQRKLKALPIVLQRKIVRKALREAARPVLEDAKAAAPVEHGALKRGLRIRALTHQKRGTFGVNVRTGTRAEMGIPEDDKYYYPAHVELGHAGVPGIPFMRNALKRNRERGIEIAAREIRAGLEAEAKSG